jgi:hypothetical protein
MSIVAAVDRYEDEVDGHARYSGTSHHNLLHYYALLEEGIQRWCGAAALLGGTRDSIIARGR